MHTLRLVTALSLVACASLAACNHSNRLDADTSSALTASTAQPRAAAGGEAVPIWVSATSVDAGQDVTVEVKATGRDGDVINVLAIGDGLDYLQLSDLLHRGTCHKDVRILAGSATVQFPTNAGWKKTSNGKQAVILRFIAFGKLEQDTVVGIGTVTTP